MNRIRKMGVLALLTALVIPVTGCGSGGSGGVGSIDEVQDATIYISASGVQALPTGTTASGGTGSGFFIDETGLAMTNYHVVAGAVTLEAYIGGDTDRTYPVSVVGASQCNDLALVQVRLRADETVPYLDWYEGEPTVGLPIYAAGYPLSDTEFTLTSGIVSKARADGEKSWASIDYTIEIDANIQQGNSGGPVVDERGAVVGVVYSATVTGTGQNQFFAIGAPLAEAAAEEMKDGDFESVGIWGFPYEEEGIYYGLWVSAVSKGSVADASGVLPGDLILELNGMEIATDGTLATYCGVLRTSGTSPIAATVVRPSTGELLEGNLGAGGTLVVTSTFDSGDMGGGDVDPEWTDDTPYEQYVSIIDDTGLIYMDVPIEWSDLSTESADYTGVGEYPGLLASTNLEEMFFDYSVPGVQVLWLPNEHYQDVFGRAGNDGHVLQSCEFDGVTSETIVTPSNGREYVGESASYINCDGTASQVLIFWGNPTDGSYHTLYLAIVLAAQRDSVALATILETLSVSDPG